MISGGIKEASYECYPGIADAYDFIYYQVTVRVTGNSAPFLFYLVLSGVIQIKKSRWKK
jgi:hypothetical protein